MNSFCISFQLCTLALLTLALPFWVESKEGDIGHLEWQLPVDRHKPPSLSIRVRSQSTDAKNRQKQATETLTISGQAGQTFLLCAQGLSTEGFFLNTASDNDEVASIYMLSLAEATGRLTVNRSQPCSEYYQYQYPAVSEQHIRSAKPFLVMQKRKHKVHDNRDAGAASGFAMQPKPLFSLSGGDSFDTGDNNDFKRPPLMPMQGKAMANLILLPTLNLPTAFSWQLFQGSPAQFLTASDDFTAKLWSLPAGLFLPVGIQSLFKKDSGQL